MTTNIDAVNDEDVINKAYLDEKLLKINGHLSILENIYNEFLLNYSKQSVKENLIQRDVKTTIQKLYDEGLFHKFQNADKVLKDFLLTTRRRPDLSEQVKDDIQ